MPNIFVSGQGVEENVSHLKSLLFLLLISGFFPYLSTREPDSWLLFAPLSEVTLTTVGILSC